MYARSPTPTAIALDLYPRWDPPVQVLTIAAYVPPKIVPELTLKLRFGEIPFDYRLDMKLSLAAWRPRISAIIDELAPLTYPSSRGPEA